MVLFGREIKCFQVLKMLLVAPLKTLGCYTLMNVSLTSACDLIFKSPDTFFVLFFHDFCPVLFLFVFSMERNPGSAEASRVLFSTN